MAQVLLAAATGAGPSTSFEVKFADRPMESRPVTVSMGPRADIGAAEFGDLQKSNDGGVTWDDVYENGAQVQLGLTNNVIVLHGPGLFRINKDATANPVAVYLSTSSNP